MPSTRTSLSLPLAGILLLALAGCSGPAPAIPSQGPASPTRSAAPTPVSSAAEEPSASPSAKDPLDGHAVSAAHPAAVAAGMEILGAGGNAADAAVATAFAVAVVEPFASGIGGGGSAVLAGPGADPVSYDYREVVNESGAIPDSGTGIPGFVAGLAEIHAEHGQLGWGELLAPAIKLAEDGFPVSAFLANRMNSDAGPAALDGLPQFTSWGGSLPLGEGDTLVQRDLADTMKILASEGPAAFYTGSLVKELARVDGIDADSLAAYRPEKVEPVRGDFGDYELVSAAPALPGAALVQLLQIAEARGAASAAPGSAAYVEKLTDAWATADANVVRHFGDPRFVDVPVDRLTDAEANRDLARDEAGAAGRGTEPPSAAGKITAGNTTHLTVVDSSGLMVSMTNTITNFWGGGTTENVGGFFLNNQLSRFASLDTPNNQPAPGRKSVSWAAPSLVLDGRGRPVLALGSPGGHQIPNILAGVLVPWALQDAPLQEAVDAPRHHLQDGVLAVERAPTGGLAALLRSEGWAAQVTTRDDAVFGSVQALEIDYAARKIIGADDSRREATHTVDRP